MLLCKNTFFPIYGHLGESWKVESETTSQAIFKLKPNIKFSDNDMYSVVVTLMLKLVIFDKGNKQLFVTDMV